MALTRVRVNQFDTKTSAGSSAIVDGDIKTIAELDDNTVGYLRKVGKDGWVLDDTNIVTESEIAQVARTGNYNDLINKPASVSQVQSDWNAVTGVSSILNKPTIPTQTSQLTNNSGFLTEVTSSQITTALGYTPANKAGDSISGALSVGGSFSAGGVAALNGGVSTSSVTGLSSTGLGATSAVPLSYVQANFVDFAVGGGQALQAKTTTVGAASGTTTVALNNSIPTSTTGTQIWTSSITPVSTTNKIAVNGSFTYVSGTASRSLAVFVFRGTTCIGTFGATAAATAAPQSISINVIDSPASTSAQTYSIRVAGTGAHTWYINQYASNYFGGTMAFTTITLRELS